MPAMTSTGLAAGRLGDARFTAPQWYLSMPTHEIQSPRMRLEWTSPVAIGGVGGSGTRLVVRMLMEMGFAMGTRLNDSLDDLDFTDTFVDASVPMLSGSVFDERVHRYLSLAGARLSQPTTDDPLDMARWGWKEPNTHVFLERLVARIPGMRYIHVMRCGLDMAHSSNLHQLRRWGESHLGRPTDTSPRSALQYWVAVHRRILRTGALMGSRFLLVNYDRLCAQPAGQLPALVRFLGLDPTDDLLGRLLPMITPPDSIGRHRQHGLHIFDPSDVDYVRSLGFDAD